MAGNVRCLYDIHCSIIIHIFGYCPKMHFSGLESFDSTSEFQNMTGILLCELSGIIEIC
jgi:hypothetical protein